MAHWKNDDYFESGMSDYPRRMHLFYSIVLGILYAFTKLMWRWKLEEAEHLLPRAGAKTGSIVICNHTSMPEVVAIVAHIWATGRRVRPIGKSEFFDSRLIAWAFARLGGIPVERGTADMKALRHAQHALQRGEDVLIFPEGTRVRTDDQPVEVHGGYAIIAQMGKAPVAPMAVCGWRDITPEGKLIMRPKKCWMRAGEQLSLADAPAELGRKERLKWLEDEGMRRVYAIRDALQVEHPGRR